MTSPRRIGIRELWLLGSATVALWTVNVALRLASFEKVAKSWEKLYRPRPAGAAANNVDLHKASELAWAVRAASRTLFSDRVCLIQALALQWLLALRGCRSTLRLGVATDSKQNLTAHAWLEYNGVILIGGELAPLFTPFPELPSVGLNTH